jgi:curved DNA-binding protein CbpA
MSGMFDLLFYMFMVAPITKTLYTKKGMMYAVGFLAFIGFGQVYVQHIHYAEPNAYRTLQVVRTATTSEVKRAYRKVALLYHPDKVSQLSQEEQDFAKTMLEKVHIANDILKDGRKRLIYDRFGLDGIKNFEESPGDKDHESSALMSMGMYYLMTAVITFLMTLGEGSGLSRTYVYTGLILMFLLEWQTKFDNFDFLVDILPYDTPFDKITIMHYLYPAFMTGARLIATMQYVNKDAILMGHIHALRQENVILHEKINQILAQTARYGKRNKGSAEVSATADDVVADTDAVSDSNSSGLRRRGSPKKKRSDAPPGARLQTKAEERLQAEEKKQASSFSIPSWAWYLGFYFVINYILK